MFEVEGSVCDGGEGGSSGGLRRWGSVSWMLEFEKIWGSVVLGILEGGGVGFCC